MKRKNDENCVVANMYAVFWFNKQNEFVNVRWKVEEGDSWGRDYRTV
jgi:hypothetical protein